MAENSTAQKIYEWKPFTGRPVGREVLYRDGKMMSGMT
jgi:hypothetical protein